MCMGCWRDEGCPWLLTPAVEKWAPVFRETDPFGDCHIVIDDWNLSDGDIHSCLERTQDPAEKALCKALLAMSAGERWATAILADRPGFRPAAE
jgi:hypothetical protein